MWSRGLLSIVLLGLISGGISQTTESPSDPMAVESCRSPNTSTVIPGPKCDYAMVIPFKLTSGSQGMICTWVKSEVPVTVTVTMEWYFLEITILSMMDTSEYFNCTSFTVPEVNRQENVYFTFSAAGNDVDVVDRKPAVIDVPRSACLLQKDKPLYKQGFPIQLRFLCFDENLKQVVKNFTKVTFVDPTGTRVSQILNPTLDHGVLITSFNTSKFSRPGYYSFYFEDDKGNTEYAYVEVQKYELPRVNFNAQCPSTISVLDRTAEINGSAVYVYGKPVPGSVVIRCCRSTPKYGSVANCFQGVADICIEFTKELDGDGNFRESLDMEVFKLPFSGLQNYVSCEITMKENGTGVLVPSSCYMSITNRLAVLQLDRTSILPFYNKVNMLFAATLTDEKGNPLAYRSITVRIDGVDVKYVTTDDKGRAECVIDTSSYYNANITVSAIYENSNLCYGQDYNNMYYTYTDRSSPYDEVTLYRYYSNSGSHIRIRPLSRELACYQNDSIQVDYSFTEDGVGKDATTVSIKYIIQSSNKIVACGESIVDLSESYKGSTIINFYTDANFATGAKVLVFAAMKKDIISDTATISVGICFKNKVTMSFTEQIVEPGATVYRKVTGEPGSFCGLRAKDASFNLIRQYDEFSPYNVYSYVRSYFYGYQYGGINYDDPELPCINGDTEQFCNGMYVKPTSSRTDRETIQDFKDLSVLLFTNLGKRRPRICGMETEPYYPSYGPYHGMSFTSTAAPGTGGPMAKSIDTFRTDFRDTFGYDITTLGLDGESLLASTIPHTITEWQSDGFCISAEKGIGLTDKPATTTTFLIFFVEVSFPSSIVRGEVLTTNVVAANYMQKCAMVTLEIEASQNYVVTPLDGMGAKCACGQQRVSWPITMTFTRTGPVSTNIRANTTKISDTCDGANDDTEPSRSDTIVQIINVVAEGIRKESSSSHLVTVKDNTTEVYISVVQPDNMVPDSFVLSLNVMGDPVALPVKNFDSLLSTPTSCCDQIQASVLSIIFLARYLKATGDLDEDRSRKMHATLSSGYMDLLACRDYNGAFSLYMNFYSINSWVTLQILRTIYYLKDHQYVDDNIITQGLLYMSTKQDLESGCLTPEGSSLIYQENVDYIVQFTALAAPILQELAASYSNAGPLLEGVNSCLDNVDFGSQNTLTQSYLLNAAASSGQWVKWQSYYDVLAQKAIDNGDILYWRNDNSARIRLYQYFPVSDSLDVLITATVHTSMTKYPNPSQDLKNLMGRLGKWLSGRTTLKGGYYSSQATSAALEALTLLGLMINTQETNAQVSLLYNDTEVFSVAVNKDNKFIVQSQELSQGFGDYKFVVSGNGSIFVQLTAYYNRKITTGENSSFAMTAQASAFECSGGVGRKIDVQISLSYIGDKNSSGPCIVSVGILSGYEIDFRSSRLPTIPEYSMDTDKALISLDTVTDTPTVFTVALHMRNTVSNFQPAYVVVEDIETGEIGAEKYYHPCGSQASAQQVI